MRLTFCVALREHNGLTQIQGYPRVGQLRQTACPQLPPI